MSRTTAALFVGLLIGLAAAFGTFGQFVSVLVFGLGGLRVGLGLAGRLDVQGLLGRATEKR